MLADGQWEKIWKVVYVLAIVTLLALLLQYHGRVISAAIPLDYYEGQMPLITGIIAEGNNPYTRPFQPMAMNVYTPLYNIIVAPLTHVFDNNLQLHRIVSAVFIFLSCGLCGITVYRQSRSATHAMAAVACVYAGFLFYSTPVASTNAVGIFLYLSLLIVPWLFNFSTRSLVFALLCGVLSFYAKQYFVIGMAILCLYVFLYRSKRAGLMLGLAYAVLMLVSLTIVHLTSPYFLDNTLFAAGISIYLLLSSETLSKQLAVYLQTYWPLLATAFIASVYAVKTQGLSRLNATLRKFALFDSLALSKPLLKNPVDYFAFCFVWASIATMVTMGRNPGNFMTYLFQLMSPFLLIASFRVLAELPAKIKFLLPLVLLVFYQLYMILPRDFSTTAKNWARVDAIIQESDQILASQMLLMNLIKHDKQVYQDGHTFYFPVALQKPRWFVKEQKQDTVEAVWNGFLADIYDKVERRQFDVIIMNSWDFRGMFGNNPPPGSALDGESFLRKHYYIAEKFPLSMTNRYGGGKYGMKVWRPKPKPRLKPKSRKAKAGKHPRG